MLGIFEEIGAMALGAAVLSGVAWRLLVKMMRAHRGRKIALRRLHSA